MILLGIFTSRSPNKTLIKSTVSVYPRINPGSDDEIIPPEGGASNSTECALALHSKSLSPNRKTMTEESSFICTQKTSR